MVTKPIVMISSYPPRLCGIGTFCEEARKFIQKADSDREVLVISHTDGAGDGVFPITVRTMKSGKLRFSYWRTRGWPITTSSSRGARIIKR